MELKSYQKNVIADLTRYLELLTEKRSTSKAYTALWNEKNVVVDGGINGMPFYQTQISGAPEVCFKVPTGGGKTYLAASSVKPIFNSMPVSRAKAVVWLVPSDAILTQTYAALSNAYHPYRQRLDMDFGSRVEVYSKTQLLNGQNFSPTTVTEQLSVFVLSYDSFRATKKDGRKAYQENGNLAPFQKHLTDKTLLLPDADETALIQVIRALNPVVIVDESHHAASPLSVDMLKNFNPCFVLELTATPKKKSNIISFVDAAQLKKANMVKLPVIVYNRKTQDDVFGDAISMRRKLEAQAIRDQQTTGRYIRPIVLLQAQPRSNADSTTYQKIKDHLMDAGIPASHIAIKTADKDVQIDFTTLEAEMARVDVDSSREAVPKAWKLFQADSAFFKEWFNEQPSNVRMAHSKGTIRSRLSKLNCVNDKELQEYIDRVVETLDADQLADLEQSPYPYVIKVERKVKALLEAHQAKLFQLWLEQGKLSCVPNYALASTISPTNATSVIPKSLYSSEEEMNAYERKMAWALSALPNIKWWHRNISRQGFMINGSTYAYPDIIAMTTSGKILMIEPKGDHLDGDDSKEKAKIGHQWDMLTSSQYRYFMVFETKSPDYPGAYSYDRFMEIVKGL